MADEQWSSHSARTKRAHLRKIAASFRRLGTIAFGGPAAHIAMMEEEFVRRRHWLSHAEFLDMLGATNLIPGPNSTELAIHIGHQRGGWRGLVVGGACLIGPAVAIVMAAAWAYVRFGSMPKVQGIMHGIKPVMVAIVIQALWRFGSGGARNPPAYGNRAGSVSCAVAIGQVTPGPVFTTATFIGDMLGGVWGGLVATIGIFVPSFVFVAARRPLLPRIRRSREAGAFLDGVNAGALALMAAVTIQLGRTAIVDSGNGDSRPRGNCNSFAIAPELGLADSRGRRPWRGGPDCERVRR